MVLCDRGVGLIAAVEGETGGINVIDFLENRELGSVNRRFVLAFHRGDVSSESPLSYASAAIRDSKKKKKNTTKMPWRGLFRNGPLATWPSRGFYYFLSRRLVLVHSCPAQTLRFLLAVEGGG